MFDESIPIIELKRVLRLRKNLVAAKALLEDAKLIGIDRVVLDVSIDEVVVENLLGQSIESLEGQIKLIHFYLKMAYPFDAPIQNETTGGVTVRVVMIKPGWVFPTTAHETHAGAGDLYQEQYGEIPTGATSIEWPPAKKRVQPNPSEEWIWNDNNTAVMVYSIYARGLTGPGKINRVGNQG